MVLDVMFFAKSDHQPCYCLYRLNGYLSSPETNSNYIRYFYIKFKYISVFPPNNSPHDELL